jgi:iron complex transport system permease protein
VITDTTESAQGRPRQRSLVVLGLISVLCFLLSLGLGPTGFGLPAEASAARLIFVEIRIPRAVLGFLIGGSLGLSGAVLQGYLRNPLAEPGLLGVTAGASLGAVTAIHTGLAAVAAVALPIGGLAGALGATFIVFLLAGRQLGPLTVILAGVAVSAIASALTALALNMAENPFALTEMLYWMMGSLSDRSLLHVWLALPLIGLGCGALLATGRGLDALMLGEDAALNMGVDLGRLRLLVIAGTALAVGAATSVAGTIGFVGLIVPHLLRHFFSHQPSRLLLPSFLGGAALVLASDVFLRLLSPAGDLRLGVVTALIGAPFFLWIVIKTRREMGP